MVQLVEITGVLNEKGCIEIPIVLLAQTGIRTGEEVNLIYLAAGEKDYRNESREFMLKRAEEDPLEELQSGETELKLPPQLLADAHIPLDADLFGNFGSFPITIRARASGKSEVYWK